MLFQCSYLYFQFEELQLEKCRHYVIKHCTTFFISVSILNKLLKKQEIHSAINVSLTNNTVSIYSNYSIFNAKRPKLFLNDCCLRASVQSVGKLNTKTLVTMPYIGKKFILTIYLRIITTVKKHKDRLEKTEQLPLMV